MFDLNNFIVTNIVNGVKNGTFTKEYANIMAVNYMLKGVLTQDDIVTVSTQIESWEATQNAVVEPVEPTEEEIPVEDVLAEETEETESAEEDTTGTDAEEPTAEDETVVEETTEETT